MQTHPDYSNLLVETAETGRKLFCEFADSELVKIVISNNDRYFIAYMIAAFFLLLFFIRFRRAFWSGADAWLVWCFELLMSLIWLGTAAFIFLCGFGHKLRARIFATNDPYWFWFEANWEWFGSFWSLVVAFLMFVAAVKIFFDKHLSVEMQRSVKNTLRFLRMNKEEKTIYNDVMSEADKKISRQISDLKSMVDIDTTGQGISETK